MSKDTANPQTEFYVSKGEAPFGPWTVVEIAERIARQEFAVTDFIYDEGAGDWIAIMDCEAFKQYLNRAKPKAPPPAAREQNRAETEPMPERQVAPGPQDFHRRENAFGEPMEWYVQKGATRHGPMSYCELVRGLQEKTVYDFDFIWKEGMETWVRIAEHSDFKPERIRELAAKLSRGGSPAVFFRRQFPRVRFESEVIVHDDRSVWMGQSFEAGVGGSGVVIENAALKPGQVVRLHFAPCDGLPAFNALGEIVGKRHTREIRGMKSPVRYAVRFLKLDGAAEPQVREHFSKGEFS